MLEIRPKNSYLRYRAADALLRAVLHRLPAAPAAERLALWWGYRYRPSPRLVRLRSGPTMHVFPGDYLQLLIYYLGTFESHCLPYLRGCVDRGGTVIDVGANIGFYTIESALAVGPAGRVVAIEAAPAHVDAIRENLRVNGLENVTVLGTAVAETRGRARLTLAAGANRGMFTLGNVRGEESFEVELRTLDDIVSQLDPGSVDLVKMDIEGAEWRALRGAARMLERYRPSLLVELNESALARCGSDSTAVKTLLRQAGYDGWIIAREGARPLPWESAKHECDECLFIHRDRQALSVRLRLPAR